MQGVDQLFDIVVTTSSGYPLDQNLYQGVKGMSAGSRILKNGGALMYPFAFLLGFQHKTENGPQDPQLGAKMAQDLPTWSQDGPQDLQLGAKMTPRPPNLEARWPQDPST